MESCLKGRVSVADDEKVLKMDVGDGSTTITLWIYSELYT